MFDDLRKDSGDPALFGDDLEAALEKKPAKPKRNRKILGMTAAQRFILSFLLFMAVCLVGALVLFATEKIYLF